MLPPITSPYPNFSLQAQQLFQEVALTSLDNNLLKYSVKGYLLNAGLCVLANPGADSVAIGACGRDVPGPGPCGVVRPLMRPSSLPLPRCPAAANALDKYVDMDATFDDTREHKLLKDLAEHVRGGG